MSKKKYRKNLTEFIHNSSFMRIKSQLNNTHSTRFDVKKWKINKKWRIPYIERIEPLLSICGKYDIPIEIPKEWNNIIDSELEKTSSIDGYFNFLFFLKNINQEEFRLAKVSNKKLHELLKKTGLKQNKIKKPKLISILEFYCDKYNKPKILSSLKQIIEKRGAQKNTKHIYISCDPWDIARMGVGKKSFGSCMNIVSSNHSACNQLFENFNDPNMAIVYVEDDADRLKINGMLVRMIIRVLKNKDNYYCTLDRLYGEVSLRNSITKLTEEITKKNNIIYSSFYNYLHQQGHYSTKNNNEEFLNKRIVAMTSLCKFKFLYPYIDNRGDSNGFVNINKIFNNNNLKNLYSVGFFGVVPCID